MGDTDFGDTFHFKCLYSLKKMRLKGSAGASWRLKGVKNIVMIFTLLVVEIKMCP